MFLYLYKIFTIALKHDQLLYFLGFLPLYPSLSHLYSDSQDMQNPNSHSLFKSFLGLYKLNIWIKKKKKVVCIKIFILFLSENSRFSSILHFLILLIFSSEYNLYHFSVALSLPKLSSSYPKSIPAQTLLSPFS